MSTATMTSKGQVTIPKDVRDALGLVPGAKLTFTRNADGDFVLRSHPKRAVDLVGLIAYDGPTVSVEQMDEAIEQAASS